MKFFIDSVDLIKIQKLIDIGLADGVTTNPSIIAKSGQDFHETIGDICKIVKGPVSAEVVATQANAMIEEGLRLRTIADNVCVKLPITQEGLQACHTLSNQGIETNLTLCFSASQALLAAKCGAKFVSPFIGRLDDISQDGLLLIENIRTIFDNYDYHTEILAASIRSVNHIKDCALIGADVITAPPDIILEMANHPLTDQGLASFLSDWKKTGQTII